MTVANDLLICFYGDDFTGSTDAMESLALRGIRTVLFTSPPSDQDLSRYPGIRAFGIAGMTRAMPPGQMQQTLRAVFQKLKNSGAPIIHYKTCSTFDSSPAIGSIGCVIDVAAEVLQPGCVPVLVGAPALGRYCVFGNLFARCGPESEPIRLDRHPSMSRHPITPMDEADLRLHLAKQTARKIGLVDVLALDALDPHKIFDRLTAAANEVVLIDMLYEHQLATAGALIARLKQKDKPVFVVGSSGVESALTAHWRTEAATFAPVKHVGPILAVCGSCSPVTARQIEWAEAHGFVSIPCDAASANDTASRALRNEHSAIIHTRGANTGSDPSKILTKSAREILKQAPNVRRVLVAGGDTAGHVAAALNIRSLEMIGELTRGSPLCRASAPDSPADGLEFTFKGGQIGPIDFFGLVRDGTAHG